MTEEFNLSTYEDKGYYRDYAVKEFIKKLKENWRKKCNKMEIMSGDVAIFELESELDKLAGDKLK